MAGAQLFINGGGDHLVTMLKAKYPTALIEKAPRFLCVSLSIQDSERPDDLLEELSKHGEIYWYHITSAIEAFEYFHWNRGILLRALDFNGSTWEIISGDSEPWERKAFFSDDELRQLPSWKKLHPNSQLEPERALSLGPDTVSAKDARNALLSYYRFWD